MNKPTIAVVNDDTAFLHLMHQLLTEEGYDCILHIIGSTAFDMIRKEQPDLVILDIRMGNPEAGWVVLDMMRLDPVTKDIPVIVCSADSQQIHEKAEHLSRHRAASLEKPFDLEELIKMVTCFVGSPPSRCSEQ